MTSYSSDNPLDIEHYDNNAYRQQIKSGITYDFSKKWSAGVEYSRTEDEDDEDGEYSQNNFLLTVRYDF
jgi:predicted porin